MTRSGDQYLSLMIGGFGAEGGGRSFEYSCGWGTSVPWSGAFITTAEGLIPVIIMGRRRSVGSVK